MSSLIVMIITLVGIALVVLNVTLLVCYFTRRKAKKQRMTGESKGTIKSELPCSIGHGPHNLVYHRIPTFDRSGTSYLQSFGRQSGSSKGRDSGCVYSRWTPRSCQCCASRLCTQSTQKKEGQSRYEEQKHAILVWFN